MRPFMMYFLTLVFVIASASYGDKHPGVGAVLFFLAGAAAAIGVTAQKTEEEDERDERDEHVDIESSVLDRMGDAGKDPMNEAFYNLYQKSAMFARSAVTLRPELRGLNTYHRFSEAHKAAEWFFDFADDEDGAPKDKVTVPSSDTESSSDPAEQDVEEA